MCGRRATDRSVWRVAGGAATGGVGPPLQAAGLGRGPCRALCCWLRKPSGGFGRASLLPSPRRGFAPGSPPLQARWCRGTQAVPSRGLEPARPAPAVPEGPVLLESPSRCLGRGPCPSVCCPHWCAGAPAEQTVPVPADVSPVPGRRAGEVEEKHGSQLPQGCARLSLRGPGCTRCRRAGPAPGPWRARSHEGSSGWLGAAWHPAEGWPCPWPPGARGPLVEGEGLTADVQGRTRSGRASQKAS